MSELRLIDVKNLLKDYGLPDLETLEYVLQQYQILINELSHNKFSKLTTAAKYIIDIERGEVRAERRGHFTRVKNTEGVPVYLECSLCRERIFMMLTDPKYKFCPRCGKKMAKMDGGKK